MIREDRERGGGDPVASIVERVAAGDPAALGELYDATAPSLLGIALAILRDRGDAEETVSDALVRVWKHAERFDPAVASAAAWMGTITRRLAIDRLRARRSAGRGAAVLDVQEIDAPWTGAGPADRAAAGDERARVRAALRELPPEERKAVAAAYFGGLPHSEIAERFGWPLGTVKTRIRNAMIRLRAALGYEETS